jgi:LPS-assembly protein
VYEDLSKIKTDRYEYIYPEYNFFKEVQDNKNSKGNFTITSDGYQKTYDTNSSESVVINDLLFDSYMQSFENGITNNYKFLLRNVNSNASNSTNYKNEEDLKLLSTFLLETKYPLLKKTEKYNNFFVPTLSFKYSPNKTKNSKNEKSRLNFINIFDIDRSGQNDLVESDQSFTLGFEYEKINKKNNATFLNLGLATVFRDHKNFDLPEQTSLGQKTSDVVGVFNLKPSKYFDFKYEFSIDNNLDQINYNNINTNISINNFITSFEFLEENKHIGENSYLINKTTYNFNENKLIRFETSKDLKKDLTEYYKLIYEYNNDCLTASIEYDKEYYSDGDLKPKENIFIIFKIIPFGQLANLPVSKSN